MRPDVVVQLYNFCVDTPGRFLFYALNQHTHRLPSQRNVAPVNSRVSLPNQLTASRGWISSRLKGTKVQEMIIFINKYHSFKETKETAIVEYPALGKISGAYQ